MFYIVKKRLTKEPHRIVEATCNSNTRWANAWGTDFHYEYEGINQDEGDYFDTRDIVQKSSAKSKAKIMKIYPQYFL